jgi:hypothetical protein
MLLRLSNPVERYCRSFRTSFRCRKVLNVLVTAVARRFMHSSLTRVRTDATTSIAMEGTSGSNVLNRCFCACREQYFVLGVTQIA